ncbi:MAG TPA: hypothetical protein VFZ65_22125, partial [Planctomycetota bacterium]|nr:hypothetical protein [Planctomycetota bacterium]
HHPEGGPMRLCASLCCCLAAASVLPAQARGRADSPPAPGGAAVRSARQELETLRAAAQRGDAVAFWDWLPDSYQGDLEGCVHDLAERVDAKVYERAMKLLARIAKVGVDKQRFLFANAEVAAAMAGDPARAKTARASYGAVMTMLGELASSDLASVEGLRRFDGRRFLTKTGKPMLLALFAIAREQGHDPATEFAGMSFEIARQRGDTADVSMRTPGEPDKVETFVHTEGRWLPEQLVRDWSRTMRDARARIAAMPKGGDGRQMAQLRLVLGTVEGFVRKFEEAETQQEFDEVLQDVQAFGGRGR